MTRVFISSTYLDNLERRRLVQDAILRLGMIPVGMERFTASSDSVVNVSTREATTCDVYLCIVAHRYGYVDPASGLSITELEYDAAKAASRPRLMFELDGSLPVVPDQDYDLGPDRWKKQEQLEAFKKKYRADGLTPGTFRHDTLGVQVYQALAEWRGPAAVSSAGDHEGRGLASWLELYIPAVIGQYETHLAQTQLNPSHAGTESPFALLVTEMDDSALTRAESDWEAKPPASSVVPFEDYVRSVEAPIVMVGEGGTGKTTALLRLAAEAVKRLVASDSGQIPIYIDVSRVTKSTEFADVVALVVGSLPYVADTSQFASFLTRSDRRFLFLIDSFNEIPSDARRTLASSIVRFLQSQAKGHAVVVSSRAVAELELIAKAPIGVRRVEVLRLRPDEVRAQMERYGVGAKFDALPPEVRELAGNLFMFFAIVRTLADGKDVPTNRGTLLAKFTESWMRAEAKRNLDYNYARVKLPILAHLAKRMTAGGQTTLELSSELEEDLGEQLSSIFRKIERIGGMPERWTVRHFLAELLLDGLIKDVGGQLQFLHQSLQEYYTALSFQDDINELVGFTPRIVWEATSEYGLLKTPEQRFVAPLLMLIGLVKDATDPIKTLGERNPILAAAALASASRVDVATSKKLRLAWCDLLNEMNPRLRVGLSCLVLCGSTDEEVLQRVIDVALEKNFDRSYMASAALSALAGDVVIPAVVRRALGLAGHRSAESAEFELRALIDDYAPAQRIRVLSERWNLASTDEQRSKIQALLQRDDIASRGEYTSKPAIRSFLESAAAHEPARESFASRIREAARKAIKRSEEEVARLKTASDADVRVALRSPDRLVQRAAVKVAAERKAPVCQELADLLLSHDRPSQEAIKAFVAICGDQRALSILADRSRWVPRMVAKLPASVGRELESEELSEATMETLRQIGVEANRVGTSKSSGGWTLSEDNWHEYQPVYEVRNAGDAFELYDLNVAKRALVGLAALKSEVATAEIRRALEDDDLRPLAIHLLSNGNDQWLGRWLLVHLRGTRDVDPFVALGALAHLQTKEAVSLVGDLFVITSDGSGETHPVWGQPSSAMDRSFTGAIHRVLLSLNSDDAVFDLLDEGLASEQASTRRAALAEYCRWIAVQDLPARRRKRLASAKRVQSVLDLSMRDPDPIVRDSAARFASAANASLTQQRYGVELEKGDVEARARASYALRYCEKESARGALERALADVPVVAIGAASSLVALDAEADTNAVVIAMRRIIESDAPLELRRDAGAVLFKIPGALEFVYEPIQRALSEARYEEAVRLVENAMAILPQDVNMHWWYGHAQMGLGDPSLAKSSFERAAQLEDQISLIQQALAETLLDLEELDSALEAALNAVKLGPDSTDAHRVLAAVFHRKGTFDRAANAARTALDVDPINPSAAWILLSSSVLQHDMESAVGAARHLWTLRKRLAPDLDTSPDPLVETQLAELRELPSEISELVSATQS